MLLKLYTNKFNNFKKWKTFLERETTKTGFKRNMYINITSIAYVYKWNKIIVKILPIKKISILDNSIEFYQAIKEEIISTP